MKKLFIMTLLFILPGALSSFGGQELTELRAILITGWEDVTWANPINLGTPSVDVGSFIRALPANACGGLKCKEGRVSIWGCKGKAPHDVYIFTDVDPDA